MVSSDCTLICTEVDFFPIATVNRILQRHRLQVVVIFGFDADQHFFNITGVVVAAGAGDFDFWFAIGGNSNEIIITEPYLFAAHNSSDVIFPFGHYGEFARGLIAVQTHILTSAVKD